MKRTRRKYSKTTLQQKKSHGRKKSNKLKKTTRKRTIRRKKQRGGMWKNRHKYQQKLHNRKKRQDAINKGPRNPVYDPNPLNLKSFDSRLY